MEQKSEHLEIPVLDGVGQGRKVVFPAVPPVHVRSVPYQPPDFLFPLVQGLIPVPYHGDDQGVALRQIGVDVLPVRNRHPRHALHVLIGIRIVGVDFFKALDVHQVLFRDHVFLKVQGLDCGMSAQPRRESRVIGDDVHLAVELFGGLLRHLYNLSVRIAGSSLPWRIPPSTFRRFYILPVRIAGSPLPWRIPPSTLRYLYSLPVIATGFPFSRGIPCGHVGAGTNALQNLPGLFGQLFIVVFDGIKLLHHDIRHDDSAVLSAQFVYQLAVLQQR